MPRIGRLVKWHRISAVGSGTHQVKTLSNKKVIMVFPPERRVKYRAFKNP